MLVLHAGKVLTHRFMMQEVWGAACDVQYLRIYVRQLRQKIEAEPEVPSHILTETGVGYWLACTTLRAYCDNLGSPNRRVPYNVMAGL